MSRKTTRQHQVVYNLTVRVQAWVEDGQEPKHVDVIVAAIDGLLERNADAIAPGAIVTVGADVQRE